MTSTGEEAGVTAPALATRPQVAQLLVLLYEYVANYVASHPLLLPAVPALRDAARLYGRNDSRGALQKGVEVYYFLQGARADSPDLPLP